MAVRQGCLDVDPFSDAQRILQFNAQIPDSAINLRVPKQELHGAKVARLAVNLRSFGPAHRVFSVSAGFQTNRCHPKHRILQQYFRSV